MISTGYFLTQPERLRLATMRAQIAEIKHGAESISTQFAIHAASAHGAVIVNLANVSRSAEKIIRITSAHVWTSAGRGEPMRWRLSDGRRIGTDSPELWKLDVLYSPAALLNAIVARGGSWAPTAQGTLNGRKVSS